MTTKNFGLLISKPAIFNSKPVKSGSQPRNLFVFPRKFCVHCSLSICFQYSDWLLVLVLLQNVYVVIVTPLKTKLKYFLFFIFHYRNFLLVFLRGTYVLSGALFQVNTFPPFQLFPACCSSHSAVLFQVVRGVPFFLLP